MPAEYSGEEQAICAVGIVKPRPGVFMAAIQHILVLCTTVEVRGAVMLTGRCHTQAGAPGRLGMQARAGSAASWLADPERNTSLR